MIYYFLVFLTIALLSFGLILLKNPFFTFARATSVLLNIMLEKDMDEAEKRKIHIRSLGNLLGKFGLLLLLLTLIVAASLIPMYIYMQVKGLSTEELDMSSFYFYLSMILGSVVLFVYPSKDKNKDYTGWSMLLHRMVLDNYNISRFLFNSEKRLFKKKIQNPDKNFVVVTGLARGGTTALTNLLFDTGRFHSLSYDNMPFLLSVNMWRKLYHPKKDKLKQRAHGDNIMFGYKTIEALEEYFFKVHLRDSFISDKTLKEHEIDRDTYDAYLTYQSLVRPNDENTTYIAKNNNLILRYRSLRKFNPDFRIVMIFRDPLTHAYSLLKQHTRFSRLHREDPFTLEYMNWLGHHEFGENQKSFDLKLLEQRDPFNRTSINYWIAIWISYYTHVLTFIDDKNLFLVDYTDLCTNPNKLLSTLGDKLKLDLSVEQREPYSERELPEMEIDPQLQKQSGELYAELKKHKIIVS